MTVLSQLVKRFIKRRRSAFTEDNFLDGMNRLLAEGFLLDMDLKGEIIFVTLAPNETKVVSHGLQSLPLYRIFLRQSGNGLVTDVNTDWNDQVVSFKNNGAETVNLTIKLFPG